MGDGPHGHRDEAQVGRRPVRRRLRGRLEALQHQRRRQDAQGKSKFVIVGAKWHGVLELTCTSLLHMALPDLSGNPKQGSPCVGPRVQNLHLLNPISVTRQLY